MIMGHYRTASHREEWGGHLIFVVKGGLDAFGVQCYT